MIYSSLIRPLLFKIDPERIHGIVAGGGELIARIPVISSVLTRFFRISTTRTKTKALGMHFPHPIGLSAGFDKDARYVHFASMFGFAFLEIGSITGKPYEGNERPRLRRLIRNQSLVVNYGLKSQGAERVLKRVKKIKTTFPFGISIAKTNSPLCIKDAAIEDYGFVYKTFQHQGVYDVLNLSCPNAPDGVLFSDPFVLERLLGHITGLKRDLKITKPLLIKIGPDIGEEKLDAILKLINKYHIDGIIIGNLFKDTLQARKYLPYPEEHNPSWKGGISGRALQKVSTDLIGYVYNKTNGKLLIIGCGGIYTAQDAYEKIKAGATLLEMITGFIYGGPTTIRNIVKNLNRLLESDGFSTIEEARGIEAQQYGSRHTPTH